MKFLGTLLAIIIFLAVGGGIYLGVADISIPQKTVTQDITPAGQ
ncbi:MAG TPA: hypothetical protein PKI93_06280 [Alphaproteobacteria bacterium]|nr:hypothetical protein [Alphaproteobacteria bacterium]HNS44350.1 hypothetical protein [Alphaproteobacteria bacterium]